MKKIEKEIAELKELVSKLLELQIYDHKMKYGYMNKPLNQSIHQKE